MSPAGSAGLTVGELRRARRAFVLAKHPDRGGDPIEFSDGLARFALLPEQPGQGAAPRPENGAAARVVVIRTPRGVAGWLRYLAAAARRRELRPVRHLR